MSRFSRTTKDETTGDTQWYDQHIEPKRGSVHVEHAARLVPTEDTLKQFRVESGFNTAADWRAAIVDLNNSWTGMGHIYRVTKR
jgi:hypothetical protein